MVSRVALLIALWVGVAAAAVGPPQCLRCHAAHYGEVGACTTCHRGDGRTDRIDIAHRDLIAARFASFLLPESPRVRAGSALLDRLACRRCHTIGGKGNPVASDLDRVLPAARPEELADALRTPAVQMPQFHLAEEDIALAVTAVLAFSARAAPPRGEVPVQVHFEGQPGRPEDAFSTRCGPCHKVLTALRGGLGVGSIGPNLSGLLTEAYPPAGGGHGPWTAELVRRWIGNPRELRPFARMRPVPLAPEDLERVLGTFAPAPGDAAPGRRRP